MSRHTVDAGGVTLDIVDLPNYQQTAQGGPAMSQLPTSQNIHWVAGEVGVGITYDVMRNEVVLNHPEMPRTPRTQEKLYQFLCDTLMRLRIRSLGSLGDVLGALGRGAPFHPMGDWVKATPWDGVDRFVLLRDSVPADNPELMGVYLRRWMIQVCEGIFGWKADEPRSLPHVFTFTGRQGLNKGRWLRSLVPPEFILTDAELHLSSSAGKDHQLELLKYPIVELGELDATFRKSDISALKAFLSRTRDVIREPYARAALPRLRGTSFVATVNDREFLNDPTGSRRYWPVEVDGPLAWDHGIDMQQMWAQAQTWWESGEDWSLTEDENRQRIAAAERFTIQPPEVDQMAAHWGNEWQRWDAYVLASKKEIMEICGMRHPSMAAYQNAARWLEDTHGKHRKLKGKQRCWPWPLRSLSEVPRGCVKITATEAKKYVKWRPKEE
jgi:putative DNA primase/helicase